MPHIPTRPCRDIPPVRPLLSYEQVMPTHLTLPEPTSTHPVLLHQNPPSTRAAKTKSSFEGGQPCERVQRSKAGGCRTRLGIANSLNQSESSQQRHAHENGRERSDRRSKSRQHNLKNYLPHWRKHSRKDRNLIKPKLYVISWTPVRPENRAAAPFRIVICAG